MSKNTRLFCLTIIVLMAFLGSGCGGNSNVSNANVNNVTIETAPRNLTITSSSDDSHVHSVTVLENDLLNPPINGMSYQSSWTMNHNHYIVLSLADFTTISGGGTVNVTSSISVNPQSGQKHSHRWSISKGNVYTSTIIEGHSHAIVIPNADLETSPAAGVTYASSTDLNHIHQVTLTSAQLETIRNGGQVISTSSTSINPITGYSHSHNWTIARL